MRTIALPIQTNVLTPVRPAGQRPKEPDSLAKAGLEIRVFPDGAQYTAILDPLNLGSCGDTADSARESLQEAIAEYKEFLEEYEVTLGPELSEQLRVLREAGL